MSLATLDTKTRTMVWLGVGNVAGALRRKAGASSQKPETLLLRASVVGKRLPPLHAATLPVVRGYVLKAQAAADLVRAIREVSRGAIYLSPSISRALVDAFLNKKTGFKEDPLTERERQVVQLLAAGKSTKEVAQVLGVSFKTAESHRMRIMGKLDIHNTAGLVRYAVRCGLVQA